VHCGIAVVLDVPEEFIACFASGFPPDWKKVVNSVKKYVQNQKSEL